MAIEFTAANIARSMGWGIDFSVYVQWLILRRVQAPQFFLLRESRPGGALRDQLIQDLGGGAFPPDSLEPWTISWKRWMLEIGDRSHVVVFSRSVPAPRSGQQTGSGWYPTLVHVDELPQLARDDGARTLEEWLVYLGIAAQPTIRLDLHCHGQLVDRLRDVLRYSIQAGFVSMHTHTTRCWDRPGRCPARTGRGSSGDGRLVRFQGIPEESNRMMLQRLGDILGDQILLDADAYVIQEDLNLAESEDVYYNAAVERLPEFFASYAKSRSFFWNESIQRVIADCSYQEEEAGWVRPIGISPAGVAWAAYRPENIDIMLRRLIALWRHVITTSRSSPLSLGNQRATTHVVVGDAHPLLDETLQVDHRTALHHATRHTYVIHSDTLPAALLAAVLQADAAGMIDPVVHSFSPGQTRWSAPANLIWEVFQEDPEAPDNPPDSLGIIQLHPGAPEHEIFRELTSRGFLPERLTAEVQQMDNPHFRRIVTSDADFVLVLHYPSSRTA
jgi:hypothetical protein